MRVLFISVGWAGLLVLLMSWMDGYLIDAKWWHPAGSPLTVVVGVLAILMAIVALWRERLETVERVCWYLIGLMVLCAAAAVLICIDHMRGDSIVTSAWPADVVVGALLFLGVGPPFVFLAVAALFGLEQRARARLGPIPAARIRRR